MLRTLVTRFRSSVPDRHSHTRFRARSNGVETLESRLLFTTYYVDLTGSDANNGSVGSPWRTISYAATKVAADLGHVIHVNPGTFVETNGCTLARGVTLEGSNNPNGNNYPAGITAADRTIVTIPSTTSTVHTMFAFGKQNNTVVETGNNVFRNITIDGNSKRADYGLRIRQISGVDVTNVHMLNFYQSGISIERNANEAMPSVYMANINIHDSTFEHCSSTLGNGTGTNSSSAVIAVSGVDQGSIYNCKMVNDTASLAARTAYNGTVSGVMDDGYGVKAVWQGGYIKHFSIHDSTISVAGGDSTSLSGGYGADATIELWNASNDCAVYNVVANNWFSFVNCAKGTGTRSLYVHDNTLNFGTPTGSNAPKIAFENTGVSDVEYSYNYVSNCGSALGYAAKGSQHSDNVLLHHNVFSQTGAQYHKGTAFGVQAEASCVCDNTRVYNNVFDGFLSGFQVQANGSTTSRVSNTFFRNNILRDIVNVAATVQAINGAAISQVTNTVFQNNDFYLYGTLKSIQAGATNTWNSNLEGINPGLKLTGAKPDPWYRASSGTSAVVNAGQVIPGITDGYSGTAPDIGRYEYASTFTVNFEGSQGYAAGNINGQNNWVAGAGTPGPWQVVNNPNGTGQVLQGTGGSRYQTASRNFSSTEVGGTFDVNSSKVAYSFDLYGNPSLWGYTIQYTYIGGTAAAYFRNARSTTQNNYAYHDGTTMYVVKNASGTAVDMRDGQWYSFTGTLDYATKKYSLFVNGVQQFGGTTDGWLGFNAPTQTANQQPQFSAYFDNTTVPMYYDNISLLLA